jgi:ssDNA-binding Zn-finger/Zn-ribbon topoisomerase 1
MEREIEIEFPADGNGMVGRQCPNCEMVFRISEQMYQDRHYLNLRCPYCEWVDEFDEFLTDQQREYAEAMMKDELDKMAAEALDDALGDMIDINSVDYSNESIPSPHSDIETDRETCSDCGFEYEILSSESGTDCPVCR